MSRPLEARVTAWLRSRPWLLKLLTRLHVWGYRITGGRIGGRYQGIDVLLLTHVGRRSGRRHTTPLFYIPRGEGFAVVASHAGSPTHPAWWRNLQAAPGEVEVGRARLPVGAEEAAAQVRQELWKRFVELYPAYEDYRRATRRRIPVVLLRPLSAAAGP